MIAVLQSTPVERLLEGKTVLVTESRGAVGLGAVRQLLAAGAQVIAVASAAEPPACMEKLEALQREAGDGLRVVTGALHTERGAAELGRRVRELAPELDAAVIMLADWWQGCDLIEMDYAQWSRQIGSGLDFHFLAARTFLPLLRERAEASYTIIAGAAARNPYPGAGPASVAAAGQIMLARVLSAELRDTSVRINALVLGKPIRLDCQYDAPETWLTGDDVGRGVVYLVSRLGRGLHGRTINLDDRKDVLKLERSLHA